MKFIKRKNLLDGEELLYVPKLHWIFIVKSIIKYMIFAIVIFILWINSKQIIFSLDLSKELGDPSFINVIFKYIFYVSIFITAIIFTCRIFQFINTEFGVTNKRLLIKKGVFKIYAADIPTDRIESIYCIQGFWEQIFNCGTIYVSGVGGMMPTFFMVSRPYALRRKIVEVIEKNKAIIVVHGKPPRPPVPEPKEDPLYLFGTFVRVLP